MANKTTHRTTSETRWFCVDKERADEIKIELTEATAVLNGISGWVLEQVTAGNTKAGIESGARARLAQRWIVALRAEHGKLWRRSMRTVKEVIEEPMEVQP